MKEIYNKYKNNYYQLDNNTICKVVGYDISLDHLIVSPIRYGWHIPSDCKSHIYIWDKKPNTDIKYWYANPNRLKKIKYRIYI